MEGINVFVGQKLIPFTMSEIVFVSIAVLVPALIYLIIEAKYNHTKITWVIFPLIIIYVIINLIGIWRFNSPTMTIDGRTFDLHITNGDKIYFTIRILIGAIIFYCTYLVLPRRIVRVKSLVWVYWFIVAAALFSSVFSVFKEMDSYKLIFSDEPISHYPSIMSFFYNENTFGSMMMMAVFAIIMIHEIKAHWWHWLFVIVFFAQLLLTTSATSIYVSLFFVLAYLVYKYFKTIKTHPIRNTLCLGLFIMISISLISMVCLMYRDGVQFMVNFIKFTQTTIFSKNVSTLSGRIPLWEATLKLFQDPSDWIIGFGGGQFLYIMQDYRGSFSTAIYADSGYIQTLGDSGILGLMVNFSVIGIFVAYIFKMIIKERKAHIYVLSLIGVSAVSIYACFETLNLFVPTTNGLVCGFIFVLPVLIKYNRVYRPEVEDSLMKNTDLAPTVMNRKMIAHAFSFILLPIVFVLALSMIFPAFNDSQGFIYMLIACGVLLFIVLVLSYLIGVWRGANYNKAGFIVRLIIFFALLIGVPTGAFFIFKAYLTIEEATLIASLIFATILLIEFILTIVFKSSAKEYFLILWRHILKPHLTSLSVLVVIFGPITFGLSLLVDMSLLNCICYTITMYFIYQVMMCSLPNLGYAKKNTKYVISIMNDNYLFRQKMVFLNNKVD